MKKNISYELIKKPVQNELQDLNSELAKIFCDYKSELSMELENYVLKGSKQIRSVLLFLFAKLFVTANEKTKDKIDNRVIKLGVATEIIHNATLIHDDIIDSANERRNHTAFHKKYNSKLAIIAGDYLLSIAIRILTELDNSKLIPNYSTCLLNLCEGEIKQYFEKNHTPTLEEYIAKSRRKTASLFETTLMSFADLKEFDDNIKNTLVEFGNHFGTAFQLRDDLNNLLDDEKNSEFAKDIENGIYTASTIFAFGENVNLHRKSAEEILTKSKSIEVIEKTKSLINEKISAAKTTLKPLPQNPYICEIENLTELLKIKF